MRWLSSGFVRSAAGGSAFKSGDFHLRISVLTAAKEGGYSLLSLDLPQSACGRLLLVLYGKVRLGKEMFTRCIGICTVAS